MVSSRGLKNLLEAYCDYCIDEDHTTFFRKINNELRIYNNLSTSPFISSSIYGIHRYDSWINCIKTKNICVCKLFYDQQYCNGKPYQKNEFKIKNTLSIGFIGTRRIDQINGIEQEMLERVFLLHWNPDIVDLMQSCLAGHVAAYIEEDLMKNWDLFPDFEFIFKLFFRRGTKK
uniref:Uncharacterized protein n=1 Tax=Glossina palpalis gambiensis TaxID=67801 RepID=A0A1B0C0H0_9MUSC